MDPIDRSLPIQFFAFSFDRLLDILGAAGESPPLSASQKLHLVYLKEYFGYFEKKSKITIAVEWKYTDRDFLEDYAAYYVRCFQQKYDSTCVRMHFFQAELSESCFRSMLSTGGVGDAEEAVRSSYLGFIVVKPLPHRFIGRTCLRTYDGDGRRHFPVRRVYDANLCGVPLKVETLAFQEQDAVASACATSALWSALQGTAKLFQHKVYSPVEITRIATDQFPGLRRAFPNHGLNPLQMAAAIRMAGLEPEVIGVERKSTLQGTAYAYLQARIPLLLNAAMFDISAADTPFPFRRDPATGHAIVVVGYSLGYPNVSPYPGTDTLLRSSRIDKLYVHDDQVGPFARMGLDGPAIDASFQGRDFKVEFTLTSSWPGECKRIGTVVFAPEALIIPVYHKIRIGYDTILANVLYNDEKIRKEWSLNIEWDVFLTRQSDFKADIRTSVDLSEELRWQLLARPFPRFLWRAIGFEGTKRRVEFIYDATDVDQSDSLLQEVIEYTG